MICLINGTIRDREAREILFAGQRSRNGAECTVRIILYVDTWEGTVVKYHIAGLSLPSNSETHIQFMALLKTHECVTLDGRWNTGETRGSEEDVLVSFSAEQGIARERAWCVILRDTKLK